MAQILSTLAPGAAPPNPIVAGLAGARSVDRSLAYPLGP
jgi:hypothetical protein